MKLNLCAIARMVIFSSDSNAMSIINVIDNFNAVGFPLFVPELAFVSSWDLEANDESVQHGLFTMELNGASIIKQEVKIEFKGKTKARNVMQLQGLVLPMPGTLVARLVLDSGPKAEITIPVKDANEKLFTSPLNS